MITLERLIHKKIYQKHHSDYPREITTQVDVPETPHRATTFLVYFDVYIVLVFQRYKSLKRVPCLTLAPWVTTHLDLGIKAK